MVTRTQFDEFRAATTDVVLKSYEKFGGGEMHPVFLFQHGSGERSHFVVPNFLMANSFTKACVGDTVKEKIKEHDIQFVCFSVEAWALNIEENEAKPEGSIEHDDRTVEILMLHYESPTFKHTTQFRIYRENDDKQGKIVALEPFADKDITDIEVGGNFAGFFPKED